MADLAERILRRWGQMDGEFTRHSPVWRACFELTFPERGDGLDGDQIDAEKAQSRKAAMLDSTASDAARLLTSSITSGMTPANSVWFGLDVGDETDEERRWLDQVAEAVWEAIHGSNFDAAKFEAVLDSVCAGWFVLYIDDEGDVLRFHEWPLSQCRIAASVDGGRIDTVYRKYKLSAEQAVKAYGDAVSQKVKDAARDKPDQCFEFIHAIEPRTKYAPGARMARNLPISSVHLECETKGIVRESGYHELPVVVPRWMQLPNSAYAIGPVSNALPTIRELNELLRLEKSALSRAAAGVYVAEDDGVLNPRTVKVRGGMVIMANSVNSIKELPSGADFNITFSKADQMRAEIRRLLMADQLQPQDGPAMTATEVHVRVALIRQLLGPLFGRFQAEDLAPTIERVFGLMYRRGRPELGGSLGQVLLDDPPASLEGETFRVRYQSPLARAQKLEDVSAMQQLVAIAQGLAVAGKAGALDLLDEDQVMRLSSDGLGAPNKALRDEKAVEAFRKAAVEKQAADAQAAQQQGIQTMAAEAAFNRAAAAA
jgi:hypothetical protein